MFPARFFNLRAFAARYFPKIGSGVAAALPTNVIIATQSVTNVARRISITDTARTVTATEVARRVTFDG